MEAGTRWGEDLCVEIIHSSPDAIFLCGRDQTLQLANPALLGLLGAETGEAILGRPVAELKPAAIRKLVARCNSVVLRGGKPRTFELTVPTRNGTRTYLITKQVQRDPSRHITGVLGIARDVSERRSIEQEIIDTSDKEKQRLGRELRENFCQHLVGITLLGNALYEELSRTGSEQAEDARQIAQLVKTVISEVRALEKGLSVTHLEQGEGLAQALEDLAEQARTLGHFECVFRGPRTAHPVEPKTAMHLFRIAQEAVHNAIQHSGAQRLQITLTHKRDAVVLSVRDNGEGFADEKQRSLGRANSHIGFSIMRHRTRALGAKLEIKHRARGGIEVICTVPKRKRKLRVKEVES